MAGMLDVGLSYKNRALSGFMKESEEAQAIEANRQKKKTMDEAQNRQMSSSMMGLGATGGFLGASALAGGATSLLGVGTGAGMGAMIGLPAGPLGIAVGAGLGFLFSKLF